MTLRKVLVSISLIAFSGCAMIEPLVRGFNIVSVPEEMKISEQAEAAVAKQFVLSKDPSMNQKVQSIGSRLVKVLPRKDYPYEFHVVEDKSPNAFTIPGGKIYVHTGLFNLVNNDNELAGVIAHEIGHAYQRHPAKSISRQYGTEALSQILFKNNTNQLKTVALQIAENSLMLRYSREDEFEADEAGFYILRRAGIPSSGLVSFFERLMQLEGRGSSLTFLSTHPPTLERITRLQELESGKRQPTLVFAPLEQNS
jgi:predicted Zn-dependent protease